MADRPIIFSAPMVRALLDGRKTQTRRVIKLCGRPPEYCGPKGCADDPTCWGWDDCEHGDWITIETDPGQRMGWRDWRGAWSTGDRLWVREAHSLHDAFGQDRDDGMRWGPWPGLTSSINPERTKIAYYREGFDRSGPPRWRSPIHMPRWASRLTLVVTDVRVQRAQGISLDDCTAEGIDLDDNEDHRADFEWAEHANAVGGSVGCQPEIYPFKRLWNSIHGPAAWDDNPWVVALTFDVQRRNIDTPTTATPVNRRNA